MVEMPIVMISRRFEVRQAAGNVPTLWVERVASDEETIWCYPSAACDRLGFRGANASPITGRGYQARTVLSNTVCAPEVGVD